jgi:hypothetical protein
VRANEKDKKKIKKNNNWRMLKYRRPKQKQEEEKVAESERGRQIRIITKKAESDLAGRYLKEIFLETSSLFSSTYMYNEADGKI